MVEIVEVRRSGNEALKRVRLVVVRCAQRALRFQLRLLLVSTRSEVVVRATLARTAAVGGHLRHGRVTRHSNSFLRIEVGKDHLSLKIDHISITMIIGGITLVFLLCLYLLFLRFLATGAVFKASLAIGCRRILEIVVFSDKTSHDVIRLRLTVWHDKLAKSRAAVRPRNLHLTEKYTCKHVHVVEKPNRLSLKNGKLPHTFPT